MREGDTFRVREVSAAAAATESGRDVPRLFVFQSQDSADPGCTQLRPSARVVREDDHSVIVAAFAYTSLGSGASACSYITDASSPPPYASLPVPLRQPLRSRSVIDASTGEAVGLARS